jgi:tRNA threonylcarbamoyladenosine modification (KEOPS) complex Cgi121 subunit
LIGKSEELNKKIAIIGFSNVHVKNINTFLEQFRTETKGLAIQFFNANHVGGRQHLYFAALNALNAFEKKTNISNNLEVEALLYASAQRQIQKAVKTMGIKQDSTEVAALIMAEDGNKKSGYLRIVSENVPGERNDSVLELTNKKIEKIKKLFNISDTEFEAKLKKEGLEKEALTDLVIERMALLVTRS